MAGSARGLRLEVPRTKLRPTMDMVKGAIFSSLQDFVPGTRVLDLFAGTGSLGIEALSRGAASVVFVESDRRAVEVIRANLDYTRLGGAEIQPVDVFRYLEKIAPKAGFDLILADPPYAESASERGPGAELLAHPALPRALAPGGIFVLEHRPRDAVNVPDGFECFRDKRYGATAVAFFRHAPREC
jgi:16S rRNA (guanine966-N2)-methyltransferase